MWSRRTWILTMVWTAHSGIFTVRRYTTWWMSKSKVREERFRCVVCHPCSENSDCQNCPLPPPAFFFLLSFTKILSGSLLLASTCCFVDELDDIRGHGRIIIDTPSHIPTTNAFFFS